MSEICQSCKDERAGKKPPLAPIAHIRLPLAVTANSNFRKPKAPTYVCPYCDGETLVSSALAAHRKREEAE